jgi:hypothetical protein
LYSAIAELRGNDVLVWMRATPLQSALMPTFGARRQVHTPASRPPDYRLEVTKPQSWLRYTKAHAVFKREREILQWM